MAAPDGELFERLFLGPHTLEGIPGNPRVDLRTCHALEQFSAHVGIGLEERGEIALCEQDRSSELIEGEAESVLDFAQGIGLLVADLLLGIEIFQRDRLALQPTVRLPSRPPRFPLGQVPSAVLSDELHFGTTVSRAPAHDRLDVFSVLPVVLILFLANPDDLGIGEARGLIVQSQAHGIEERALARAGGPGD